MQVQSAHIDVWARSADEVTVYKTDHHIKLFFEKAGSMFEAYWLVILRQI